MSFSADKVSHLKGAFSQRRFSSSKDPSESGTYLPTRLFFPIAVGYVIPEVYNPMEVDLRKLGAPRCLRWGFGELRHSDVTA